MISLETFKKCIKAIQYQDHLNEQLTKLLVGKGCTGWVTTGEDLINAMRALLKDAMNDKYDYIDWWLYDVDEGNRQTYENFEDFQLLYGLKDLDSLYYYIIGDYNNVPHKIQPLDKKDDTKHEYKTCSVDEFFNQVGIKINEVNNNDDEQKQ